MRDQYTLIKKILAISVVIIMLMSILINTDGNLTKAGMITLVNRMINEPVVKTEVSEISKKVNSNLPKDIMIHKVEEPTTQNQYEAELLDMVDRREFTRKFKDSSKKRKEIFGEDYQLIFDAFNSIS